MKLHVNMLRAYQLADSDHSDLYGNNYFWTWILRRPASTANDEIFVGHSIICAADAGICISPSTSGPKLLRDPKFTIPLQFISPNQSEEWQLQWYCWKASGKPQYRGVKDAFTIENMRKYWLGCPSPSNQDDTDWQAWEKHNAQNQRSEEIFSESDTTIMRGGLVLDRQLCQFLLDGYQRDSFCQVELVGADSVKIEIHNSNQSIHCNCFFKGNVMRVLSQGADRQEFTHHFYTMARKDHIVVPVAYMLVNQDLFSDLTHSTIV